eukprot:TRINITY_DN23916_c0_g1_i1.p1 TRINITY_DN23916_c0_g1~~TRINITY_DN23916_c0_g1_i1.p1  ORF type:complete len:607 (-),score=145.87 TRINITY_DN23916_c0_g1_i1:249-2069(-)
MPLFNFRSSKATGTTLPVDIDDGWDVGARAEYFNDAFGKWQATTVSARRGSREIALQCKPGVWFSIEEPDKVRLVAGAGESSPHHAAESSCSEMEAPKPEAPKPVQRANSRTLSSSHSPAKATDAAARRGSRGAGSGAATGAGESSPSAAAKQAANASADKADKEEAFPNRTTSDFSCDGIGPRTESAQSGDAVIGSAQRQRSRAAPKRSASSGPNSGTAIAPRSSVGLEAALKQKEKERGWDAHEIVPGLWVGSISAAESENELMAHNIRRVVTVARRLMPNIAWSQSQTHKVVKVTILEVEDQPQADILEVFPRALRNIDKVLLKSKDQATECGMKVPGVLVHCASGVSRSVATCMAWLMSRRQWTLDEALERVQEVRPQAQPNFGFIQALRLLEYCKGDLEAAHRKWERCNREENRAEAVTKLRKEATDLHDEADSLEEALWRERCGSGDKAAQPSVELKQQLETLRTRLSQAGPGRLTDDSTARGIRGAATDKVCRLLGIGAPKYNDLYTAQNKQRKSGGQKRRSKEAPPTGEAANGRESEAEKTDGPEEVCEVEERAIEPTVDYTANLLDLDSSFPNQPPCSLRVPLGPLLGPMRMVTLAN